MDKSVVVVCVRAREPAKQDSLHSVRTKAVVVEKHQRFLCDISLNQGLARHRARATAW